MKEILLENVRVAFPNLTSKHAIEGFPNSVPKYGLTVLLEPTDPQCQMIRDAVNELALAQWGDNYQNIVNNLVAQGARACFFGDGNTKITKEGRICDGFENMMFVSGKNEKMPQMIDTLNPDKDVTPEEAMILAGSIYGGCMVNVSLDIYVQKDMQGIRASVSAVQFWRAGEPFGTTVGDQRSKFKAAPTVAMGQQPMGQQPMGQQPMGQPPMGQPPMGQQPMAQQPMAQQPMAQQPMAQQPMAQQPMAQQPMAQQPMAQQPMGQPPATQVNNGFAPQTPVSENQPVQNATGVQTKF